MAAALLRGGRLSVHGRQRRLLDLTKAGWAVAPPIMVEGAHDQRAKVVGRRMYHQEHHRSIHEKELFWLDLAREVDWFKLPPEEHVLSTDSNGIHRWFKGGLLNTSHLCLDVHVDKYNAGNQVALYWDSPVTGRKERYTYSELRDEVSRFAKVLRGQGVEKGDRVIIYMPMIPEAVISMLACARLGAIHSVVFGGFAPKEIVTRVNDLQPKVMITANYGIEVQKTIDYKKLVDEALSVATHPPSSVIVFKREERDVPHNMVHGRDVYWHELMQDVTKGVPPVPLESTDPLYVLHTSGTTGTPKGIVRDNGGHAVALKFAMRGIMDTHPGEVFFAASDVGWVVGHSFIVYGPLLKGCSTILYEGKPVKTPDAGAFWRICEEYKVKSIFAAPTSVRAIRKEDPDAMLLKKYDISTLKGFFLAGERLDPATFDWLQQILPKQHIVDNWWQTETGWPIVANPIGMTSLPPKKGSATVPMPGYNILVLDDEGHPVQRGELGNIVIKQPLPPGCFPTVYNDHKRKVDSYLSNFPGFFETGDYGLIDDDGYVFILGRVDDVINCAGHRLSTGQIEEIVGKHPAVAECAVIGVGDDLKGEVPTGFVVLKDDAKQTPGQVEQDLIAAVRSEIGAVASFRNVYQVPRLPKTRSGKILRKTMRKLTEKDDIPVPPTIDDTSSIEEFKTVVRQHRIGPLFSKDSAATEKPLAA